MHPKVNMNWIQDIRYSSRLLLRSPGFTLVAILVLALGVGATTAIFTVFYSVLLKPLPYGDPAHLYQVYETFNKGQGRGTVSVPNLMDWRAQSTSFDFMAFELGSRSLQDSANAERLRSCNVEARYFHILKSHPLLGRVFAPDENPATKPVLISEALWRKRFGASPDIVGKSIQLDGIAQTVIGVMPLEFEFPPSSRDPISVWTPLEFPEQLKGARGSHSYFVVARLREAHTAEAGIAEMTNIADRLSRLFPNEQDGRNVYFRPLSEDATSAISEPLQILLGAVGIVFLISGVNLANLLLARAASRAAEVSVRAALGASRRRLVQQFLVESLLLSGLGALAGLWVAQSSLDLIRYFGADYLPRTAAINIHTPVLLFLILLALLNGLGFGLVPALRVSNANLGIALRESSGRTMGGGSGLRRLLVGGQIALAFLLLIGAGLLFRTLLNLKGAVLGFETRNKVAMRITLPAVRYDSAASSRFYDQLTQRLRALPGVEAVGLINMLPLESWGFNGEFAIVGKPTTKGQEPYSEYRMITPGYFEAMGIPILAGRDFSRRDPDGKLTSVIINEKLAQRYFPNENPIGQRLQLDDKLTQEVIGVVRSTRSISLDSGHTPEIYVLASQAPNPMWVASMSLVVSARIPTDNLVQSIRGVVGELDAGLPVYNVRTLDEVVDSSLGSRNLLFHLILGFAVLALVLAMAGVYGVISYLVTARTREFGLRLALGASRLGVILLVLRESATLVIGGLVGGAIAALGLSRLLMSMLHGVTPEDPLTFATVALTTALIALLATVIPAWRACRVDPMVALREL